jgi:hypothetical protein
MTYVFQERRFAKQKRLEVSLQPLEEQRVALNEIYRALVDCFLTLSTRCHQIPKSREELQKEIVGPVDQFATVLIRNWVWLSPCAPELRGALSTFRLTRNSIASRMSQQGSPPQPEFVNVSYEDLMRSFLDAVKAIGQAKGVEVLEKSLKEIIPAPSSQGV